MSHAHTQFPAARLPDLPARQIPTTSAALCEFVDSPDSPFVLGTREGSGYAYEEVVQQWLVPVLERVCGDQGVVRGLVGSEWGRVGGGRGKGVVMVWVLTAHLLNVEYTPATHPADLLRLVEHVVGAAEAMDLQIPAVAAKVAHLSLGILGLANYHRAVAHVLPTLWTLLGKTRPSPGSLTGTHVVFLEACLLTRNLQYGMALVDVPVTDVTSCPLRYMDYLGYHYLAGIICIGLKQWSKAREMLQIAVAMPGSSVSAIQIAAHKKLVLVNLILTGKETTYPKFVNQQVINAFSTFAAEYAELAKAYAGMDRGKLQEVLSKPDVFQRDQNYGLLLSVYEAIPARKVIQLTETYVKLDMTTLARKISVGSFTEVTPDQAEQLIFQLVTQGDLFARITHPAEGQAYVEFTDDPDAYKSSGTVDRIGVQVVKLQEMAGALAHMEQALSTHEAWLKEAIKRDSDKRPEGMGLGGTGLGGGLDPRRSEQEAGGSVRGVGSNWADAGF